MRKMLVGVAAAAAIMIAANADTGAQAQGARAPQQTASAHYFNGLPSRFSQAQLLRLGPPAPSFRSTAPARGSTSQPLPLLVTR